MRNKIIRQKVIGLKLVKADTADFDRVKAAYIDISENTPDMDKYARYEYGKHPNDAEVKGYIASESMYMFMDNDSIAGVIAITASQGEEYHPVKWQIDISDDEVMVLHLLGIVPAYQGMGVGKEMIRHALQLASEKSLKACRLDTLASNTPAQRFYEKLGFTYCGKQHWYAENTGWTDFYLYEYIFDSAKCEVYMHGQILGTHSFYLKDGFLQPDEYSELKAKYFLPGGETGTAATVLSSLGVKVKIDGTHIGTEVAPMLRAFYESKSVDLESLYFDPEYEGLMDYVVVADLVRSPMGTFQALYANNEKRWNAPQEADIAVAKVAGIDPFFMEETIEAAKLCVKNKVPYVTIDCPHTDYLHQNSAINIVSKECLSEHYKGIEKEEVFEKLISTTDGLVIITTGQNDMIYGRKNTGIHYMPVFATKVKSTLGAGDTFKAGCIYGLLHGFTDENIVRFAGAASSIAISRYPLPLNPPTLDEINSRL